MKMWKKSIYLLSYRLLTSHPDLFHLSLWWSPPPSRCCPSSPLSPVYLYLCSRFVCCQFILFARVNQCFASQLLLFPVSLPLGFDLCQSWLRARMPDHSACPWACLPADLYLCPLSGLPTSALHWPWACLPSGTIGPPGLLTHACLELIIACPCWDIKLLFIWRGLYLGLTFIPDNWSHILYQSSQMGSNTRQRREVGYIL
jgi:hypothetical protein